MQELVSRVRSEGEPVPAGEPGPGPLEALLAEITATRSAVEYLADSAATRGSVEQLAGPVRAAAEGRADVVELARRVEGMVEQLEALREGIAATVARTTDDGVAPGEQLREVLEARLATIEDTLEAVSGRLESVTRDVGASSDRAAADLTRRFDTLVTRDESAAAAERANGSLTRLGEAVGDALDEVSGAVEESLSGLGATVHSALDEQAAGLEPAIAAAVQRAVREGLATTVEDTIVRVLQDQLDAVVAPVVAAAVGAAAADALAREVPEAVEAALSQALPPLVGEAVGAVLPDAIADATAPVADRLGAVLQGSVDAFGEERAAMAARVDAMAVLVEDRLEVTRDTVDAVRTGVREESAALRVDLADALEEVTGRLASSVDSTVAQVVTDVRDSLASEREVAREDSRTALAGLVGQVGEVVEEVRSTAAEERDLAADQRDATVAAVDSAQVAVREAAEAALETLSAAHEQERQRLQDAGEALRDALVAEREQAAAQAEEHRAAMEQLHEKEVAAAALTRGELIGASTLAVEDVRRAAAEDRMSARADADELRDAIATSVETVLATLTEAVQTEREQLLRDAGTSRAELAGALRTSTEEADQLLADARGALATEVAALREDVAFTAEELGGRLDDGLEAVRAAYVEQGELIAGVTSSVDVELTAARAAVEEAAQAASAMTDRAVTEARTDVGAVTDELRSAAADLAGARQALERVEQRFGSAGTSLVAYLADRDRVLEGERDRLLREVLEEFAAGLAREDRRSLAQKVTVAVERRRDARDAERWRGAEGGRPPAGPPPFDAEAAGDVVDTVDGDVPGVQIREPGGGRPPAAGSRAGRAARAAVAAPEQEPESEQEPEQVPVPVPQSQPEDAAVALPVGRSGPQARPAPKARAAPRRGASQAATKAVTRPRAAGPTAAKAAGAAGGSAGEGAGPRRRTPTAAVPRAAGRRTPPVPAGAPRGSAAAAGAPRRGARSTQAGAAPSLDRDEPAGAVDDVVDDDSLLLGDGPVVDLPADEDLFVRRGRRSPVDAMAGDPDDPGDPATGTGEDPATHLDDVSTGADDAAADSAPAAGGGAARRRPRRVSVPEVPEVPSPDTAIEAALQPGPRGRQPARRGTPRR